MKEKDINNGKGLEKINSELFGSFDPEDELWIVGGSRTVTYMSTYTPTSMDVSVDFDWVF